MRTKSLAENVQWKQRNTTEAPETAERKQPHLDERTLEPRHSSLSWTFADLINLLSNVPQISSLVRACRFINHSLLGSNYKLRKLILWNLRKNFVKSYSFIMLRQLFGNNFKIYWVRVEKYFVKVAVSIGKSIGQKS